MAGSVGSAAGRLPPPSTGSGGRPRAAGGAARGGGARRGAGGAGRGRGAGGARRGGPFRARRRPRSSSPTSSRRPAVGAVEARTLEHHTDGVEDLAQLAGALRALGQRVLAEALELLEGVTALGAGVLVGGHGSSVVCDEGSESVSTLRHRLPIIAHGPRSQLADGPGIPRVCEEQCPRARRRPTHPRRPARRRSSRLPRPDLPWWLSRATWRIARWVTVVVAGLVLVGLIAVGVTGGRAGAPSASRRPRARDAAGLDRRRDGDPRRPRDPATSTPTPPRTCSTPRGTCRPRTASSRWTSGATSRRAVCRRCSARTPSTPTSTSGRSAGAGRAGGAQAARRRHAALPPGLHAPGSTPTSARTRCRRCRWSTACSGSRAQLHGRAWTPVDSIAWLKAMAWDLRGNMTDEIDRAIGRGSPHRRADPPALPAVPLRPAPADPGVRRRRPRRLRREGGDPSRPRPSPARAARARAARAASADALPQLVGSGDGIGSNSWVVDGAHSETGHAAAGQRPAPRHLACRASGTRWACTARPSDAECPFDVTGFTFAGLPGVIIGHNADIAWGFTNLGPDVDRPLPGEDPGPTATYGGKWRPADAPRRDDQGRRRRRRRLHRPLHQARAAALRRLRPSSPRRAPTPPSPTAPRTGATGTASRSAWTALIPSNTADAIFELDKAKDWNELPRGGRRLRRPSQNLVYADTQGNIGYQSPGMIPIRKPANDGWQPVGGVGPSQRLDRTSSSRSTSCPVLNPTEGYIVTANQAVIGPRLHELPHQRLGLRLPQPADPRPALPEGAPSPSRTSPRCSSTTSTTSRRRCCPTCSA